MSAVAPQPEVLGSLLLRTSTSAPDEKVLAYLERMRLSQTDVDGEDPTKTPPTKTKSQVTSSPRRREEEATEDIASDVQEGERSTIGSLPGNGREPGPEDSPGTKYESYRSSWGNFGPLPPDSFVGEGTPIRVAGVALPPSVPSTKTQSSRAGSRVPGSQHHRTRASKTNEDPAVLVTTAEDILMSPPSKTRTADSDNRSLSSRSMPHGPHPHVRDKASSTAYPSLPPSHNGGHSNVGSSDNNPMSNLSYQKARSIAASHSPGSISTIAFSTGLSSDRFLSSRRRSTAACHGSQVDEVALSIWPTQTYKRYVWSEMTDDPAGSSQ